MIAIALLTTEDVGVMMTHMMIEIDLSTTGRVDIDK